MRSWSVSSPSTMNAPRKRSAVSCAGSARSSRTLRASRPRRRSPWSKRASPHPPSRTRRLRSSPGRRICPAASSPSETCCPNWDRRLRPMSRGGSRALRRSRRRSCSKALPRSGWPSGLRLKRVCGPGAWSGNRRSSSEAHPGNQGQSGARHLFGPLSCSCLTREPETHL